MNNVIEIIMLSISLKAPDLLSLSHFLLGLRSLPDLLLYVVHLPGELTHASYFVTVKEEEAKTKGTCQQLGVGSSFGGTHIGNGVHARAKKAIRVTAQFTPRLRNIGVTKRGKLRWLTISCPVFCPAFRANSHPTPKSERRTELAANTEAA